MPTSMPARFLFEPFIETDVVCIRDGSLVHRGKSGWIELTIGVVEKDGAYRSFNPSIAVAENAILSLEEKFQGGTGVNLTPPPESIIPAADLDMIRAGNERAAAALGIRNYARLDVFWNTVEKKMVVIEANALPGLTGSTVIFQQALAESPSRPPREFLEGIIDSAKKGRVRCEGR